MEGIGGREGGSVETLGLGGLAVPRCVQGAMKEEERAEEGGMGGRGLGGDRRGGQFGLSRGGRGDRPRRDARGGRGLFGGLGLGGFSIRIFTCSY